VAVNKLPDISTKVFGAKFCARITMGTTSLV